MTMTFHMAEDGLFLRKATLDDIHAIVEVEKAAWGEGAASEEMFESRITTFPEGVTVALKDKKIVGVSVTEIVNYDTKRNSYNWYQITDRGFIKKSHDPSGDTLYGVDLSIHPQHQSRGIGKKMTENVLKQVVRCNAVKGLHGSRLPHYHKYADRISVEDYIKIKGYDEKNKIPQDPELAFYLREYLGVSFEPLKIISDYYQDPESLNYGLLLLWRNKYYQPDAEKIS